MAREELMDGQLEDVVGGAFNFYTSSSGASKCYVDDLGTSYFVSATAFTWIVQRTAGAGANDDPQVIVDEAIAAGYFWK